jgi:hypothetical protein
MGREAVAAEADLAKDMGIEDYLKEGPEQDFRRQTKLLLSSVLRQLVLPEENMALYGDGITLPQALLVGKGQAVDAEHFLLAQSIKTVITKLATIAESHGITRSGSAAAKTAAAAFGDSSLVSPVLLSPVAAVGRSRGVSFSVLSELLLKPEASYCDGERMIHECIMMEVYEAHLTMAGSRDKVSRNVERLQRALADIVAQREALESQREVYSQYLNTVRANIGSTQSNSSSHSGGGSSSSSSGGGLLNKISIRRNTRVRMGSHGQQECKFTHKQLKDRRVIVESDIDEAIAKHLTFTIGHHEDMPGKFEIAASIKGLTASSASVFLDELLDDQARGISTLEMEQVTLNVNKLIRLLNSEFLARRK